MQKQHLKQCLRDQKKHYLQFQQQFLLSLSPKTNRVCSSRSNYSKLVPTLVDLPDIDEIQALLDQSGRKHHKQVVKQAIQVVEKQDFIAQSIVTRKLRLNQKPTKDKFKESAKLEMHQHQNTVSITDDTESQIKKTRAQSANVNQRQQQRAKGGGFVYSRYYQFASQGQDKQLGSMSLKSTPLSICPDIQGKGLRMVASKESDVHLVQIGESWRGEPIMKYSAWNNQQRGMPLKMQFSVERIQNKFFLEVTKSHPSIINEELNENDKPNKFNLTQNYQRFINVNQMQYQKETKISSHTLAPIKSDEETQLGKIATSENFAREQSGFQNTSQQLVENKYSQHSANQTLNTNNRYLKNSVVQNPSEDLVQSELIEKEFLHDHFVRLETELTFNDLMLKPVSSNEDQRNGKTQRNLSTPQHQRQSPGLRRSVLSKQIVRKSKSRRSGSSSPQIEKNQSRQSQIKQNPKISFTVETSKTRPQTGKNQPQIRNITKFQIDQTKFQATTDNLQENQSQNKQKPASVNYVRKTYGQRIQELVKNFDKKFILENAQLPQAIKTDLQFKQCHIQSKKRANKIVVDAQMVKGITHSLKGNSTQENLVSVNSSALVLNSDMEKITKLHHNVIMNSNRIISMPNEDIEHVCRNVDKPASPKSQRSQKFRSHASPKQLLQKQQLTPSAIDIDIDWKVLHPQNFNKPTQDLKESPNKFKFQQKLKKRQKASTNPVSAPKSATFRSPVKNQLKFLQNSNDFANGNGPKHKIQKAGMERKLNEVKFQHKIGGLVAHDDEVISIGQQSLRSKIISDQEEQTTQINIHAIELQNTMHTLKVNSTDQFIQDLNVDPLLKEEILSVNFAEIGLNKPEIKAKPVIKSKVRIQSGKMTAQYELMRIQHIREFMPSDQIAQKSQARRYKAMSGNQIASVKMLKAQKSIPKLAQSQNRIDLTYGDLQSFFKSLAKSSKNKSSRIQTNAASVTGKIFGLESSGIKVLRDLSARSRGFSGICRGQRPKSSQPNGPSDIVAADSVLITSKTLKGLIKKRVLNSFVTKKDQNTQNTIQTAGRTTALSKLNESAEVEKFVKIN